MRADLAPRRALRSGCSRWSDPGAELGARVGGSEGGGRAGDVVGDPVGERGDQVAVLAGGHVLLLDRGDAVGGEDTVGGEASEGRPHAAVDEGDLAVDELEAADVVAVVELGEGGKDGLALGVRPPAADDGL